MSNEIIRFHCIWKRNMFFYVLRNSVIDLILVMNNALAIQWHVIRYAITIQPEILTRDHNST